MISLALLLVCSVAAAPSPRIINGDSASENQFPHQVSLQTTSGWHFCGGSLISENYVLTAAHCVAGKSESGVTVVLNDHDLVMTTNKEMSFNVAKITMHEDYGVGEGGYPNDIALMKLATSAPADNIVKLATKQHGSFSGETGTISGWGSTEWTEEGVMPAILQTVDLEVLSNTECRQHWGSYIVKTHICVFGKAASCKGDSGGPLMCEGVLAGVTSWGVTGCHDNGMVSYPSVFVRVSEYLTWITEHMD